MKKYLIGNFKSNMNQNKINEFIKGFDLNFNQDELYIGIAPGDFYLFSNKNLFIEKNINVFAQDAWYQPKTHMTGKISYEQLKDENITNAILGHSDLRKYEDDKSVNQKAKVLMENDFTTLVCVGEPLEKYEDKTSLDFVLSQLSEVINYKGLKKLVIAYEPIWAINNSSKPLDMQHINYMINGIKTYLYNCTGLNIPLLYGGSVNKTNTMDLLQNKSIDGFLIGGASLDVEHFKTIIALTQNFIDNNKKGE